MADIKEPEQTRKRPGVRRYCHRKLMIDMTPMVDLGFLLIAFFILTNTLSEPGSTFLNMPKETVDSSQLAESLALTFLIGENDRVHYYHGSLNRQSSMTKVHATSYSFADGMGKVIRKKQMAVDAAGIFDEGRNGIMVLIKPSANARYQNVIDALDEMLINDVRKYAIVSLTREEEIALKHER